MPKTKGLKEGFDKATGSPQVSSVPQFPDRRWTAEEVDRHVNGIFEDVQRRNAEAAQRRQMLKPNLA